MQWLFSAPSCKIWWLNPTEHFSKYSAQKRGLSLCQRLKTSPFPRPFTWIMLNHLHFFKLCQSLSKLLSCTQSLYSTSKKSTSAPDTLFRHRKCDQNPSTDAAAGLFLIGLRAFPHWNLILNITQYCPNSPHKDTFKCNEEWDWWVKYPQAYTRE